jgi:hypothetical protein
MALWVGWVAAPLLIAAYLTEGKNTVEKVTLRG